MELVELLFSQTRFEHLGSEPQWVRINLSEKLCYNLFL